MIKAKVFHLCRMEEIFIQIYITVEFIEPVECDNLTQKISNSEIEKEQVGDTAHCLVGVDDEKDQDVSKNGK